MCIKVTVNSFVDCLTYRQPVASSVTPVCGMSERRYRTVRTYCALHRTSGRHMTPSRWRLRAASCRPTAAASVSIHCEEQETNDLRSKI